MSSTHQTETPPSTHLGNGSIPDFIRNLNARARKLGTKDASQVTVPLLDQTISILTMNSCVRLGKVISHLCSESVNDECKFLAESAVLFFRILAVCTVKTSVTEARRFYLSYLIDHLYSRRANPNAFADFRNIFTEQSLMLTVGELTTMLDTITSMENTDIGENIVNDQWRDIIGILFTRNQRMKKKDVEESGISSYDISTTGIDEAARGFIRFKVDVSTITPSGIFSPVIEVHGLPWSLWVRKMANLSFLEVYLYNRKSISDIWSINLSFELSIINIGERKNQVSNYETTYDHKHSAWGADKFAEWKNLIDEEKGFIKDNQITIEARFTLTNIVGIRIHPHIDFTDPNNPSHDVAMIIEGKKIYVNKGILAIHSDYFDALFYGPFAEKDKKEIELKDFNKEEFINMLNMIYPSYEKITDANFESLLKMADYCHIKIIFDKVEQFLIESTKLNVTRKLKLSDQYRLIKLQDHCLDSLKTIKDIQDLKDTNGYGELSNNVKGTLLEKVMKLK